MLQRIQHGVVCSCLRQGNLKPSWKHEFPIGLLSVGLTRMVQVHCQCTFLYSEHNRKRRPLLVHRRNCATIAKDTSDGSFKFGYGGGAEQKKRDRNASGLHHVTCVNLPPDLKTGLELFYKKYPRKVIEKDGQKLVRYLKNRGRPTERTMEKYQAYINAIKTEGKEKAIASLKEAQEEEMNRVSQDKNQEIRRVIREHPLTPTLKPHKSNYSYIRYKERETAAFAASRIQACYGVTLRVLHEIKKREPDFTPTTLLDFGSGAGTAVWAAHSLWGDNIKEYQCIDTSDEMNELHKFLLRGGENEKLPPKIPAVFYSKFMPYSHRIKYDITIAAYTLSELPFSKNRKVVIDALWKKTNHFMVIIEYGNNEGFEISLQARDYVTKTCGDSADGDGTDTEDPWSAEIERFPGHVFSPCPHDSACARSEVDFRSHPCNFDQKVELSLSQRNTKLKKWNFAYERFSHVVLRKGEKEIEKEERSWPRLLKPLKKRKGHVICELCCENGNIERHVLSKAKDQQLYKGVRHCAKWGDQLPPMATSKKALQVIEPPNLIIPTQKSAD